MGGGGGGGRSRYSNTYIINLKASFLPVKTSIVSITLTSGVQNCNGVLEWMIQCVVLAVGPLPPLSTLCPPDIIHVMNVPSPSLFFASHVLL